MEYIGFWVTQNRIRPINNKLESIVNMMPLTTQNQVRSLIGLLNYYRDIWSRRSHLLQPLTALTKNKVNFKCMHVEQKAFDDIKCAVACKTLFVYSDFNKRFDIHTDPSN